MLYTFALLLPAANLRPYHLIGPSSLRVYSVFLLKVRFLTVSQEEGKDAKLMVDLKVRDGFQDALARG